MTDPVEPDERRYNLDKRVTQIEFELNEIKKDMNKLSTDFTSHLENEEVIFKEMMQKLNEVSTSLNSMKGFIGGVVFILTAVWTFMTTFKDNIVTFLKG